jgi:hypothetical protein
MKETQEQGDAAMAPAKEEVRRLLELLPDDASLEDIQYHIYLGIRPIESAKWQFHSSI